MLAVAISTAQSCAATKSRPAALSRLTIVISCGSDEPDTPAVPGRASPNSSQALVTISRTEFSAIRVLSWPSRLARFRHLGQKLGQRRKLLALLLDDILQLTDFGIGFLLACRCSLCHLRGNPVVALLLLSHLTRHHQMLRLLAERQQAMAQSLALVVVENREFFQSMEIALDEGLRHLLGDFRQDSQWSALALLHRPAIAIGVPLLAKPRHMLRCHPLHDRIGRANQRNLNEITIAVLVETRFLRE